MNPRLDDWLSAQPVSRLRSKRKALKFLLEAYSVCVGDMANKPRADVISQSGGYAFHVGSPLPDLRQVSSWMMSHAPSQRRLAKMIPALWKRHGREDISIAGLLMANVSPDDLGQNPWMAFIHLLQRKEALATVLEVGEELVRAGHEVPDDEWMRAASAQSPQWHQYTVLFVSLRKNQSLSCRDIIVNAPKGGELFERIRHRLLESEH